MQRKFRLAKKIYLTDMWKDLPNPGGDFLLSTKFHENQIWPKYNQVHSLEISAREYQVSVGGRIYFCQLIDSSIR